MQNAFNMTHPVIPQSNTFATLEYLQSLGIDDNFNSENYARKSEIPTLTGLASENFVNDTIESLTIPLLTKITLTDPVITDSATIASQDNGDEITITQNISEFIDSGYVSNVNSLSVSAYIMIMQNINTPIQNIVDLSCNITRLGESYEATLNQVHFAQIDKITCEATSSGLTIYVKANSNYPILGSGVIQISVGFNNKTAYKLTIGDVNFNITTLQTF